MQKQISDTFFYEAIADFGLILLKIGCSKAAIDMLDWCISGIVLMDINKFTEYHHDDVIMDSVSNHQPHGCLLSRFFGRRSK